MDEPEIRYATSTGGVDIAWQELGREDGPRIVWISGFISHLELNREFPGFSAITGALARRCRVLAFDKRGTGLSGRTLGFGSLEERTDDLRAVMDAAGWGSAHLYGISEGGPMAILFAAQHPERVESLSLYGTGARFLADDGYAGTDVDVDRLVAGFERHWGTGRVFGRFVAGTGEAHLPFLARFERNATTPKVAAEIMRRNLEIDVRDLLPAINVPTLVLHASGDPIVPVAVGRYLAEHIPGARYVEIDSPAHASWEARDSELFVGPILEFVAGALPPRAATERALATVLFTDVVDSTRRAADLGDREWRALLDRHDDVARRVVEGLGGRLVKQTGDGILATFDGPGRAVRGARELGAALAPYGVPIRAGVHTGEVELRGDDVGGIAVHIAARVAALAGEGEVLVSRTVRDLTVGSDLRFEDRGEHELKGVPEPWQLYAATAA